LKASATGSMVYRYLKKNRDKPIEKKSLDGLYTAVMTDTGCFKYSNTNVECHQIAIECLNSGVETHKIYQNIYENSTKPRMKLMGEFLSNINYELSGMFAWSLVTLEMLKKAKAKGNDVEGFSDMARSITGVEVAVMIFQQEETMCRINFRSKGKIIINDIARELGGGGHPLAAGAKIEGEIKEVSKMVVDTTIKALKNKIQQLA
jgi:phosphoesterase RecJ-like protein